MGTHPQDIQRENLTPHDVLKELTEKRGLGSRNPRPACPGSTISVYPAIHRGARNPKRCRLFENENCVDIADVPSDEDDVPSDEDDVPSGDSKDDVPCGATVILALNGRFGQINSDSEVVIEDDDVDEKTVQLDDEGQAEAERVHNRQLLARKILIRNVCKELRGGLKTFASQKRRQCCSPGCNAWRSFGSKKPCPFEDRHEEMARDYFMALEQEDEGFAEPSIHRGPVHKPKVRSGKKKKTSKEDSELRGDDLACGSHSCAHRPDVIGAEKRGPPADFSVSPLTSEVDEEETEPLVPPSPYPQLNLLGKRRDGTYSMVFDNKESKETGDTVANAKRSDGTYSMVFGNGASKQTRDTVANAKRSDGTYSMVFGNGASKQTGDTVANAKRSDGTYSM